MATNSTGSGDVGAGAGAAFASSVTPARSVTPAESVRPATSVAPAPVADATTLGGDSNRPQRYFIPPAVRRSMEPLPDDHPQVLAASAPLPSAEALERRAKKK